MCVYIYLYIYIHTSSLPASCLSMQEAHHTAAGYMEKGSGTTRRERAVGRGSSDALERGFWSLLPFLPKLPTRLLRTRMGCESRLIPGIWSKTPVPRSPTVFGVEGHEDVLAGISWASASLATRPREGASRDLCVPECWSMCVLEA